MTNLDRSNLSEKIYLTGLLLLAAALPFSNFLMSVSQFILAAAWLAGGDYQIKFKKFFQNKPAVIFSSFYLIHLAGMIYTSNLNAGMNDLRIKLPLLLMPFILSSMNGVSIKFFRNILWAFVASVLLQTILISINKDWLFISPIRLSMMVSFSVFVSLHLRFSENRKGLKGILSVIALWLLFFLVRFPFDTGIVTFVCALFIFAFLQIVQSKSYKVKAVSFFGIAALLTSVTLFIYTGVRNFYGETAKSLATQEFTSGGEKYVYYPERKEIENGSFVWRHIAWTELENAWNHRSALAFNGDDKLSQPLHVTLIRFLTSKGLKKDAEGISKLSPDEIHAIENGTANVRYMDGLNLGDRLYETIWSVYHYQIGNSPQGNSVTQRFEFWKAGWSAFLKAPVFGNGTGSVVASLNEQYEKMNSALDKSYRLKTHNQYLATAVALGCVGFGWILFSFLFPVFYSCRWNDVLFLIFLVIALSAMLVEDTLETQAGVTFVAFFYFLLLFSSQNNNAHSPE